LLGGIRRMPFCLSLCCCLHDQSKPQLGPVEKLSDFIRPMIFFILKRMIDLELDFPR
jgi:hypothetical protein